MAVGPVERTLDGLASGGVRVALLARIASAQIRLQIDVGFGDAVTPEATSAELPALLDFPAPSLLVYPRETVVAEMLEAIVQLGMANSRMKDYYDIVVLSNSFEFQGQRLLDAIRATFKRRGTMIPKERPVAFTSTFTGDARKTMQWTAFVKKSGIDGIFDLCRTVTAVAAFLKEPLAVAITAAPFAKHWSAKTGWNRCQLVSHVPDDTCAKQVRSSGSGAHGASSVVDVFTCTRAARRLNAVGSVEIWHARPGLAPV